MNNYAMDAEFVIPTPTLSEELRQEIIENNYGRDAGWIVEHENQPLALLTDCSHRDPDMFWDQYKITWLTQDEVLLARTRGLSFWHENEFVFRNRKYPDVGLPSGQMISPHPEEGTVGARRLYLDVEPRHMEDPSVQASNTRGWIKKWLLRVLCREPKTPTNR